MTALPAIGERRLVDVTAPLDLTVLRRYAEASLDFNPMHLDDDFARAAGRDGVIVHGMLTLSLVVERARAAFGPGARARGFQVRFPRALDAGKPLHVWVQVERREDDVVTAHVSGEDAEGRRYVEGELDVELAR